MSSSQAIFCKIHVKQRKKKHPRGCFFFMLLLPLALSLIHISFQPGSSGKIFAKLGENGINIRRITQGPEELNIIVGVDSADFEKAIRVLYNSFVK